MDTSNGHKNAPRAPDQCKAAWHAPNHPLIPRRMSASALLVRRRYILPLLVPNSCTHRSPWLPTHMPLLLLLLPCHSNTTAAPASAVEQPSQHSLRRRLHGLMQHVGLRTCLRLRLLLLLISTDMGRPR